MTLTHENYFTPEAMLKYMSYSQFKNFEQCEARALAEINGEYKTSKEAYKEGKYFESCISGTEEIFLLQNPDMVSSRGSTKGELKSNFKKVLGSVKAFRRQQLFSDIVDNCEGQVIIKGEISGIPFKGCIDFLDKKTLKGYDTKCVKDFKKVYSEIEKMYISWFFAYGYDYQAAIYRELLRQTYGIAGQQHIIAVTKEDIPDVSAFCFTDEILDNALEIIKEYAPRYNNIKMGIIEPEHCGICDYCRGTKTLTDFEVVSEFE